MNPNELKEKLQEINDNFDNITNNHELVNEFDSTFYSIHPVFHNLSLLLVDYIINVNEKITTLQMASFFEEHFPEMIKSDPIIFADPDLESYEGTIFAQIFKPSYESICHSSDQYQKQKSIYRYINIIDNISDEINSMEGKSIDLIKESIHNLSLSPIEIEDCC